jgi:hypothetical protein
MKLRPAPELVTQDWLNTPEPLTLAGLKGRIVLIEAFQMLCPGCVSHGLPQAQRVRDTFAPDDVAVIGVHTVFEHHAAQGSREALEAFLHEYRVSFPVAIDAPTPGQHLPQTMQAYHMQGTPTLILVDRQGRLRQQTFGRANDLALGASIGALLKENTEQANDACEEDGCPSPTSS